MPVDDYTQYICMGAHCKCLNLDRKCRNYHRGDHTCPSSKPPITPSTPNSSEWLDDWSFLFCDFLADSFMPTICKWCGKGAGSWEHHLKQAITNELIKARIDEVKGFMKLHTAMQPDASGSYLWLKNRLEQLNPTKETGNAYKNN